MNFGAWGGGQNPHLPPLFLPLRIRIIIVYWINRCVVFKLLFENLLSVLLSCLLEDRGGHPFFYNKVIRERGPNNECILMLHPHVIAPYSAERSSVMFPRKWRRYLNTVIEVRKLPHSRLPKWDIVALHLAKPVLQCFEIHWYLNAACEIPTLQMPWEFEGSKETVRRRRSASGIVKQQC